MTASTHVIASTISVCGMNLMFGESLHPMPIAIAAFAGMLPDIDSPQSHVGRLFKPLSGYLYRTVGHRTLTHSILGWLIVGIVFYPLKWIPLDINLYRAAIAGYISHSIIDFGNVEGVGLTYPLLRNRRWVFPYDDAHRIKTGSEKEHIVRILGLVIMMGFMALNLAGAKSMLHSFLGTPDAIAREHGEQLAAGHRIVVKIKGVWTQEQGVVSDEFDVVASTSSTIFVRRARDPLKIYQVAGGEFSAISHARLELVRRIRAEQRIVIIKFSHEKWREDLRYKYSNALVSGWLRTRAKPPEFGVDEFLTIQQFGERWWLTHAPIELVSERLQASKSKLSGELYIRYWRKRE